MLPDPNVFVSNLNFKEKNNVIIEKSPKLPFVDLFVDETIPKLYESGNKENSIEINSLKRSLALEKENNNMLMKKLSSPIYSTKEYNHLMTSKDKQIYDLQKQLDIVHTNLSVTRNQLYRDQPIYSQPLKTFRQDLLSPPRLSSMPSPIVLQPKLKIPDIEEENLEVSKNSTTSSPGLLTLNDLTMYMESPKKSTTTMMADQENILINELRQQICSLNEQLEKYEGSIEEMNEMNSNLNDELTNLNGYTSKINKELRMKETENNKLVERLKEKNIFLEELQGHLINFDDMKEQSKKLKEECLELSDDFRDLENKNLLLITQLENLQLENNELNAKIINISSEKAMINNKKQQLDDEIDQLKNNSILQMNHFSEKLNLKEKELQQTINKKQIQSTELIELKMELENLRNKQFDYIELKSELDIVKEQNNEYRKEILKLKNVIDEKDLVIMEKQHTIEGFKTLTSRFKKFQKKINF
eukprot:TRINITY_DN13720_c0_g1_i1.p1 TRINITY_DN13720_c0_g1~~TRINITY_DN13720_c0_g1_i1.p1  ORF type:complete len:474 (+),score=156.11 TRINITY_DN13720_c0_g1_i1:50-1471(+)